MVTAVGKYKIPFDAEGNLIHRTSRINDDCVWKDNFSFEDTIRILPVKHRTGATYFDVISLTTQKKYCVFSSSILEIMLNTVSDWGEMTAIWTFVKKGESYGLTILASKFKSEED